MYMYHVQSIEKKSELDCNFDWINTVSLSLTNLGMYDTWVFNGNVCSLNYINPLHAKCFWGNINIYLHFMSLLHIDLT